MTLVSCLAAIKDPLILDASVVVNLNATGYASQILHALPVPVLVPGPVVKELKRGALMGHSDATDLQMLLKEGIIDQLEVSTSAQSVYIALVAGSSASSLGDGEAATIAGALTSGAWAAIDERKARGICQRRYKSVKIASTVDILCHPAVTGVLSNFELSSAVLAALEVAHMQVQKQHIDWVVGQIDPDRIEHCVSLPRNVRQSFQHNSPKAQQNQHGTL